MNIKTIHKKMKIKTNIKTKTLIINEYIFIGVAIKMR